MLSEEEIRQALHASRVVPLAVANPHGPLGLEQLAAAVAQVQATPVSSTKAGGVRRAVEFTLETWEKLDQLARATTQASSRPVSASQVAVAIVEQFVATRTVP